MSLKIFWLRERFEWMGQHSGYDQVCGAIVKLRPGNYQSVWRKPIEYMPRIGYRFLLPIVGRTRPNPFYNVYSAAAELNVVWKSFWKRPHLVHITYVGNNLGILPDWSHRLSIKTVGTVHQPAGWWRSMYPYSERVSALDAVIVPASNEVSYFEQYLPGRVYFIPHGVDTVFFRPKVEDINSAEDCSYPRCVFSGKWLRDTDTMAQVIGKVIAQNAKVRFDMIVPTDNRDDPAFSRIARYEQVCWHAGVSDEQLREIYRRATRLVLPLLDCTANNTLLEAIACGLPGVSNDVGGVPDYTHVSFAERLPLGDVDGFVEAVLRLANDPQECRMRGVAARSFAEQHLSWGRIADRTFEVYEKVLLSESN